jgi:hypothetical protein
MTTKTTTTGDMRAKVAATMLALARKETTAAQVQDAAKQLNAATRKLYASGQKKD